MTKKPKTLRPASKGSKQVVKTATVTPTSERIIKATSVKRRTAMKVLANR